MMNFRLLTVLFFTLFIFGCVAPAENSDPLLKNVLKVVDGEPVIPRSANRIFIKEIKKISSGESVSYTLFIKLKNAINRDGRLVVESDFAKSDLMVEVLIKNYVVQNIRYNNLGQPVIKRMKIVASSKLYNIKKKRMILYDNHIQAFKEFSDINPPIMTQIEVLSDVLENLSKRIARKTITGWYTEHMTIIEKGSLE